TKTITATAIPNQAPIANAGADFSVQVSTPATLNGDASTDSDGTIAKCEWDYTNDGTYEWSSTSLCTTTYTYTTTGVKTAKLRVTDDDGATSTDTVSVTVTAAPVNQPPVAVISANPTNGYAPLSVSFDATGSTDSDGTVSQYKWDFDNNGVYDSTASATSHTYTSTGNYVAKLTVIDDDGAEDSETVSIAVTNAPDVELPTVTTNSPTGTAWLTASSVSYKFIPNDNVGVAYCQLLTDETGSMQAEETDNTITKGAENTITHATTDGSWNWNVKCYDAAGNSGQGTAKAVKVDTTAPSVPSNVHSTSAASNSISLSWTASADSASGIASYEIYRGGSLIGTTASTIYTDLGLTPETSYSYTVKAIDNAGWKSPASSALTASTTAEYTPQAGEITMHAGDSIKVACEKKSYYPITGCKVELTLSSISGNQITASGKAIAEGATGTFSNGVQLAVKYVSNDGSYAVVKPVYSDGRTGNLMPVIEAGPAVSIKSGQTVTFNQFTASDPDGTVKEMDIDFDSDGMVDGWRSGSVWKMWKDNNFRVEEIITAAYPYRAYYLWGGYDMLKKYPKICVTDDFGSFTCDTVQVTVTE
ncbi:MAG: PKD domain-containing protein, partial [Candidatus Micrarchaeota archaeon]